MKRQWTPPELVDQWTLTPTERALVDEGRDAHTRLGCAGLLRYFLLDWLSWLESLSTRLTNKDDTWSSRSTARLLGQHRRRPPAQR